MKITIEIRIIFFIAIYAESINADCYDSFTSKNEMESKGWVFDWNDKYVFRPKGLLDFCLNVPSTSYCGFRHPGDGEISFIFSTNGKGTLTYGQSWARGSVHVYMNNQELGSTKSFTTSSISFEYSSGNVLRIKELGSSVINIHSLCTSPESSDEKQLMHRDSQNDNKKCSYQATSRLFKFEGANAQGTKCIRKCEEDPNCVAVSGVKGQWCIGCKEALSITELGAIAFVKAQSQFKNDWGQFCPFCNGTYDTMKEAEQSCKTDSTCEIIYDLFCDGIGYFCTCPAKALIKQNHPNGIDCIYRK